MQKVFIAALWATLVFFVFSPFLVIGDQINLNESRVVNQYISQKDLERSDALLQTISSPQIVYGVLVSFSLLIVITTYFTCVALLFIFFFNNFS